jgi:glyoxylase I family protein
MIRMLPIKARGLDHVVLRVSDIERSIAFYGEVLGFPVERRIDDLGLVQLRAGNSLIDLVDIASPLGKAGGGPVDLAARNIDHFALSLARFDEPAIRDHLGRFGVKAGDTGTRYGAEGYGPSIYIEDPDGNTVELKGPPETDAERQEREHKVKSGDDAK